MAGIKNSISETIGDTPVVRINKLAPEGVEIFVKLEAFNPMGSVKDRLALGVIEEAEKDGTLAPGQTIVEATSGNTGIGLAMICAQKGYPLVVTMAESFSVERRKLMRFLGVQVVLTPASEKGTGMVTKARELAETHGWFQSRQFENPANADIHARTTAVEIARDFEGIGLDYWVSGFGTGGTLNGVARGLRKLSPDTKIVVAEPNNAQLLASGEVQPFRSDRTPEASHPGFRPHLMQGWSPDFISALTYEAMTEGYVDHFEPVSGDDAMAMAKALACQEGIFCGPSGGATFAAALAVAKTAQKGSRILAMLPDTGERYLSTPLFADVPSEMTEAEKALSMSTPNIRFDVTAAPAMTAPATPAKPEAALQVERIIREQPVVIFSLEWCEFCWSVRKMFENAGIAYESIDLGSVAYQTNDLGADLRAVLRNMTGVPTIPQIFVGGQHIGGATETFDAFNEGSLQKRLISSGIEINHAVKENPYSFLPTWLHPR